MERAFGWGAWAKLFILNYILCLALAWFWRLPHDIVCKSSYASRHRYGSKTIQRGIAALEEMIN